MPRVNKETMGLDVYIGQRIAEVRVARGWSRIDLATKMKITHQQLQKYEKGTNRLSVTRLVQLMEIVKKPIEYFIVVEPNEPPYDDRICLEMCRLFRDLTRLQQGAAVQMFRTFVKAE